MRRLLWDADRVAKASFILWWWRQLFPLQCWSPVDCSPVDIVADGRVLKEGLQLGCIVIGHFEEPFERPDPGAFFLEKLDDCFSFSLIGGGGVRQ